MYFWVVFRQQSVAKQKVITAAYWQFCRCCTALFRLYPLITGCMNLIRISVISMLVSCMLPTTLQAQTPESSKKSSSSFMHEQRVPSVLRLAKPRSEFDISHQYYVGLLRLALQKAAKGREIPKLTTTGVIEQRDSIQALTTANQLEVFWSGTDITKEQALRPIRIPLERGLMGFRKFTLVRNLKNQFDKIRSLEDLKQYKACLGRDWPDVKILQSAGLPVVLFDNYEELFKQVNAGACDYFPRGLHEGKAELSLRAAIYPNLVRYQDIILHYPFAVYYFTSKDNEALAKWIEEGLELLISSGELKTHMQQHPLTRHVFPLHEYTPQIWIHLPNPLLTATTDFNNRRYWIVPADFE
jgi:hypothetical protein